MPLGAAWVQGEGAGEAQHSLWTARVSRPMLDKGLEAELHYAACKSWIHTVPHLRGDRLVLL